MDKKYAAEVIAQAKKEFQEELFKNEVERYKKILREKKSFWDMVFPYKLLLVKKGEKK